MKETIRIYLELILKAFMFLFLAGGLLVVGLIIVAEIFFGKVQDIDSQKHFYTHKKEYLDVVNFYKKVGTDKEIKKIENLKKALFYSVSILGESGNSCIEFKPSDHIYDNVIFFCDSPNSALKIINSDKAYSMVDNLEEHWYIGFPWI